MSNRAVQGKLEKSERFVEGLKAPVRWNKMGDEVQRVGRNATVCYLTPQVDSVS